MRVKLGVSVVRVVVRHTIIQPVPGRVRLDKVTRVVMQVTLHIELVVGGGGAGGVGGNAVLVTDLVVMGV